MARKMTLQLTGAILLLVSISAPGQENDDYAARIHQEFFGGVRLNPRLQSMGGAFVAHSQKLDALTGNPAGLAALDTGGFETFGGMYELSGDDLLYNGVLQEDPTIPGDAEGDFWLFDLGAGVFLGEFFNVGLAVQDIESHDEEDEVMAWDHDSTLFFLVIGGDLSESVSLGYRFGYQIFHRDGESHHKNPAVDRLLGGTNIDRFYHLEWDDGYVNTLGLQWGVNETVRLGLTLDYIIGNSDVDSLLVMPPGGTVGSAQSNFTGDADEWGVRGGVSWDVTPSTLLAFDLGYEDAEWDHDSGILVVYDDQGDELSREPVQGGEEKREDVSLAFGVEQQAAEWLFIRGGFQYVWSDYENDFAPRPYDVDLEYPVYSGGFGLHFGALDIDYVLAYTDEGQGDWTNLLGVSLAY